MPVRRLQRALARRGLAVHRRSSLPYGFDPLLDLERLVPNAGTILDVGANEGRMALAFARSFPRAHVFAFEPVPTTFSALEARTSAAPTIHCFELALGDRTGDATVALAGKSGQNSLLNATEPGPSTVTFGVTTGDAWAASLGITTVDVLKVDTEGYDLAVLGGFDGLLRAGRVEAVLVECELERVRPEPHASFFELFEHLTSRGLGFTTLYTDSVFERRLAWGNALFVRADAQS